MNQEPEFQVPIGGEDDRQLQDSINLPLLRLDSFKINQQNCHPCTTCASNPMKPNFPESTSEEPKSRKPSLSGFSKLPLPQLGRSMSDHYSYNPPSTNLSENSKAMEEIPFGKANVSGSALPLRRSISDHFASPVKCLSKSSSSNDLGAPESIEEDRPSAKRLKKMKEWMQEMNQWVDEEGITEDGDVCNAEAAKDNVEQADCEEATRVEKIGDCLDLHFKCPCGKGYKILLSGKNCYYKLI
ncbi:hypothetical protein CCACVL1_00472 [Corchorus capsularis]|uniref:Uncharacterized protein n=1 Tax=Corchorus capsularis TaxID=210143 RepID=A0A1R3KWP8_COCAP|nr:hypothetical protein CCACVL1_00472 [Corchorus capsularis]